MKYLQDIYLTNLNAVCYGGDCHEVEPGGEWSSYGEISFTQSKFYYIIEGKCIINIGDRIYTGKPGDWFLIPKNTKHSYYNVKEERFRKYWIHFDLFPDVNLFDILGLPYFINVGENRVIRELFEKYNSAQKSGFLADKLILKSTFLNLFSEYIRAVNPEGVEIENESKSRLTKILSYIHENLAMPVSNDELAQLIHMHTNHFIRFFKTRTGFTPAQYIRKERLEIAKRMLEETELNISEIAERIGFNEISHFSRVFKEHFSMPPGEYRRFFKNNPVKWTK